MLASVRALLSGIIDYAGMFPPAKLPLDQAIRNYARYRTEPESWMLGRFICQAARLSELETFLPEMAKPPILISTLGRGGKQFSEFYSGIQDDLQAIVSFKKSNQRFARVDSIEVRVDDYHDYHGLLGAAEGDRRQLFPEKGNLPTFYEYVLSERNEPESEWRKEMAEFVSFLHDGFGDIGFKFRCGGLEPAAFPTSNRLAHVINRCRRDEVPLKLTAGLHHPIRHFDPGVQTVMHGFINVFAAGVLTFVNRLNEKEIQAIIEDEDPKNFVFDDEGLRWKTYRAKTAQVEAARREFITSFGSCSFDEPRDDLRALGLIPPPH